MSPRKRGLGRALLLAAGVMALVAPGCRPPTATGSALATAVVVAYPAATTTATVTVTSEATGAPTPVALTTEAATATVAAPATPTPLPTSRATARPSRAVTATPSPQPTFTPPPPPPPVEGEHLYWQRPVPASGPTWTDKAYPYGATRGGYLRPHHGVEFVAPPGTPVLAVAAGTVRVAGDDSQVAYGPQTDFYGNLVVLELDAPEGSAPVYALYGHLSEVAVTIGQRVAVGETLGLSGASGVADGPHLHLEARFVAEDYATTRNPLLWLAPLPGTGIVAGRVVTPSGALLHEAPVMLQRVDGPAPYSATTSYATGGPNADINENFVIDDVEPGFYEVIVGSGARRHTAELWVYPGRINWVEVIVTP